eukprot:gene13417-14793_t
MLFWKAFERNKKVADLSLLPPCSSTLKKHIQRSSYVASLWRQANQPLISAGCPSDHGWESTLTPGWIDKPYPDDIAELLIESVNIEEIVEDEDASDLEYFSDSSTDEDEF